MALPRPPRSLALPRERIGKRASFGCVRMHPRDMIALYDRVHIGMHVTITQKPLSDFLTPENIWAATDSR